MGLLEQLGREVSEVGGGDEGLSDALDEARQRVAAGGVELAHDAADGGAARGRARPQCGSP